METYKEGYKKERRKEAWRSSSVGKSIYPDMRTLVYISRALRKLGVSTAFMARCKGQENPWKLAVSLAHTMEKQQIGKSQVRWKMTTDT